MTFPQRKYNKPIGKRSEEIQKKCDFFWVVWITSVMQFKQMFVTAVSVLFLLINLVSRVGRWETLGTRWLQHLLIVLSVEGYSRYDLWIYLDTIFHLCYEIFSLPGFVEVKNDVRLVPIELIRSKCDSVRQAREAHLINKAKTLHPFGINKRDEAR